MRVKASSLRRIIQEELRRSLNERGENVRVHPGGKKFDIDLVPTRPEEGEETVRYTGDVKWHDKRALPKPSDRENLPMGYAADQLRKFTGQLSSPEVREALASQLAAMGLEASTASDAVRRLSKGDVMHDALVKVLSLGSKLRGKGDRAMLEDAVRAILDIKTGFTTPSPFSSDEEA